MRDLDLDLLSSYAGLIFLASLSIFVGSFGSLPSQGRKDNDSDTEERLSSSDAWLFPVVGSASLLALYTVVKYLGSDWINWFLGWYFSFVGIGSIWKSSVSLTRFLLGPTRWKAFDEMTITFRKGSNPSTSLSWKTPSLILLPFSTIPSIIYSFSSSTRRSVLITDVLSLSFSHNALALMKIDSFQTGAILLSGLFFYDIWWVFGTEVMVKVATSLDIPIKLLWPKSLVLSGAQGYTMLGLGDVVVPGTLIALALRYDHYRSLQTSGTFAKPYFYSCFVAYIVGLVAAFTAMHVFDAAQPALLYLSPACILSIGMTAALRGEVHDIWCWNDNPEDKPKVA